jgi:gamma-glutamylcyclotransferase (GGCT)/AIG2-like uncharacterized protein YtfP
MKALCSYLFVYGTLLNTENEFGAYLLMNSTFYSYTKFRGKLFDIGGYPGAIFQGDADGFVYGRVFLLNDPREVLKILDDYEGFGRNHPQPNEFIRQLIKVKIEGAHLKCWVYLYNLPIGGLKVIESGKYL